MGSSPSKSYGTLFLESSAKLVPSWDEWGASRILGTLRTWALASFLDKLTADVRFPFPLLSSPSSPSETKPDNPPFRIDHIPSHGLEIVTPGNYVLSNSVSWTPPHSSLSLTLSHGTVQTHAAIRISCSNVSLDMGGHTITCSHKHVDIDADAAAASAASPPLLCVGIAVLPREDALAPLANIRLLNGTVQDFFAYGVFVVGVNGVCAVDVRVRGLRNTDTSHTSVGLFFAASKDVHVRRCGCSESTVRSKAHSGVQLRFCTNVCIRDLDVASQTNATGGSVGLALVATRLADISHVHVSDMTVGADVAPGSSGNTCLGIFLYLSAVVALSHSRVENVQGSCDDSHGISVFVCPQHVSVRKCVVSRVATGFRSPRKTGAKATGIEVMVAADVQVHRCNVDSISASNPQDRQVAGFSSGFTWRVAFESCAASNCTVVATAPADESGQGAAAPFYGVGFGWAPDPRPLFIQPSTHTFFSNCTASQCDIAFDMFMHQHARLVNCSSRKCKLALNDNLDEMRHLRCDRCSECDPPIVTALKNKGRDTLGTVSRLPWVLDGGNSARK